MKKIITFIILLFANIVLLAHSFLPHHHHSDGSVYVVTHCCSTEHNHEGCTNEKGHNHDSCDGGVCEITEDYTLREQSVGSPDNSYKITLFSQLFYACKTFELIVYDEIQFSEKPCVNLYHSAYYTQSTGLRAPPVC
jgi:hypothetical protein